MSQVKSGHSSDLEHVLSGEEAPASGTIPRHRVKGQKGRGGAQVVGRPSPDKQKAMLTNLKNLKRRHNMVRGQMAASPTARGAAAGKKRSINESKNPMSRKQP